jgi:hypothetical protein
VAYKKGLMHFKARPQSCEMPIAFIRSIRPSARTHETAREQLNGLS